MAKERYFESRAKETDKKNEQLSECLNELTGTLEHTLQVDHTISFDSLRITDKFREFVLPIEVQDPPQPPKAEIFSVKTPGFFGKLIPGAGKRYQNAQYQAKSALDAAQKQYKADMAEREAKIKKLREEYEKEKQAYDMRVQQRNQEVDEFEKAYGNGESKAVSSYCAMVLERSKYPGGFPCVFRVAYVPERKELVIEYELPTPQIVPSMAEYRYVKNKDSITEKQRKPTEVKNLYQNIIAAVCIRTIHEILEADRGNHIFGVAFNGVIQTVDRSTGHDIRPCLISARTTREKFGRINLNRIDVQACLQKLGAQISKRPHEMISVTPIVEFVAEMF